MSVFRGCEEAECVLRDVGTLSRRSRDGGRENCGCVTGTSSCVLANSGLVCGSWRGDGLGVVGTLL